MNKNIFYLTALLFVFGCSNQSSETETAEVQKLKVFCLSICGVIMGQILHQKL